jgi:hypothetical protein
MSRLFFLVDVKAIIWASFVFSFLDGCHFSYFGVSEYLSTSINQLHSVDVNSSI